MKSSKIVDERLERERESLFELFEEEEEEEEEESKRKKAKIRADRHVANSNTADPCKRSPSDHRGVA